MEILPPASLLFLIPLDSLIDVGDMLLNDMDHWTQGLLHLWKDLVHRDSYKIDKVRYYLSLCSCVLGLLYSLRLKVMELEVLRIMELRCLFCKFLTLMRTSVTKPSAT